MPITLSRRTLATALAAGAATLGLAGTASADTTTPLPDSSVPAAGHHAHSGLLSSGLFKTIFGVFGAVRTQVPTIAAPIVSDAVTAGTITQAQADEINALLTATRTPFAKPAADPVAPVASSGAHHAFTPLAPEQLTVLSKVMEAVSARLPAIAKPVVDAAVAAGDVTQAQADLITKVIGMFASFKPGAFSFSHHDTATPVSPVATLQSTVTKKVVKKARKAHSHTRHATR